MNTLSLNDEQVEQIVLALTVAAQNVFTCGVEHPNPKTADELIKKSDGCGGNSKHKGKCR